MIRRFVCYWFTCRDGSKPSARAWARQLGISHTWIQKLVRRFEADPNEMRRLQAFGEPKGANLNWAQERSRQMRERGELRFSRRAKLIEPRR